MKSKISSKLIFARCVWYSDGAYYWYYRYILLVLPVYNIPGSRVHVWSELRIHLKSSLYVWGKHMIACFIQAPPPYPLLLPPPSSHRQWERGSATRYLCFLLSWSMLGDRGRKQMTVAASAAQKQPGRADVVHVGLDCAVCNRATWWPPCWGEPAYFIPFQVTSAILQSREAILTRLVSGYRLTQTDLLITGEPLRLYAG